MHLILQTFPIVLTFLTATIIGGAFTADVITEASSPVTPVRDGHVLNLECSFTNLAPGQIITISREVYGGTGTTETLSWNSDLLPQNADSRFYIGKREQGETAMVYLLSVLQATLEDAGLYICAVLEFNSGIVNHVAVNSVRIDVMYFPEEQKPNCTPSEGQIRVTVDDQIILNCSSVAGIPPVSVTWIDTRDSNRELEQDGGSDRQTVYSQMILNAKVSDNNTVFTCRVSSPLFPDKLQKCSVGPVIVSGHSNQSPLTTTENFGATSLVVSKLPSGKIADGVNTATTQEDTQFAPPSPCPLTTCAPATLLDIAPWIIMFLLGVMATFVFLTINISMVIQLAKLRRALVEDPTPVKFRSPEELYIYADGHQEIGVLHDGRAFSTFPRSPPMYPSTGEETQDATHFIHPGISEMVDALLDKQTTRIEK